MMNTPCFLTIGRRLLPALGVSLLLAEIGGPLLRSAERVYATGDAVPTVANNDVIKLSGPSGAVTLSNGQVLNVSGSVVTPGINTVTANNVTFTQNDPGDDTWALFDASQGAATRAIRYTSATNNKGLLTLDRVIIANSNENATGGGLYVAATADVRLLTVNGDTVFLNNASTSNGGGISVQRGSLEFAGNVTFDSNKAGYTLSTDTYNTSNNGAAIYSGGTATGTNFTFDQTSVFLHNVAANSGGAVYGNTGNLLAFVGGTTFVGNTARAGSGGGIYLNATGTVTGSAIFNSEVLFDGNTAGANGGGVFTAANASLFFNGVGGDGGTTVTFVNNRAGGGGGAFMAGTISFAGKLLSINHNAAGLDGGGISASTGLTLNGAFDISSNHAGGSGGGIDATALQINAAGTLADNIAVGDGGGLYARGDSTFSIGSGVSFLNNTTAGLGGAIAVAGNSTLSLSAQTADIVFQGNQAGATIDASQLTTSGSLSITAAGTANAIHFAGATDTLALDAGAGQSIAFYDPITASDTTTLTVTKDGVGTVRFRGTSPVTAATTVNAGAFELSQGAVYGSSNAQGSFELKEGAVLAMNGTLKAGSVTLGNGSTLKVIENGVFSIDTAAPVNTGTGITLAGSGTLSMNDALDVAKIQPGESSASAGTLTLTDQLTLANGGAIVVDLFSGVGGDGYNLSDRVDLQGGSITLGGNNTIEVQSVKSGIFDLGNIGSLYGSIGLTVNGEAPNEVGRQSASLSQSGADLILTANADFSRVMTWTGASGTATWDALTQNWTDSTGVTRFGSGDQVIFNGTADTSAMRTITIGGNGAKVSDLFVSGSADYTFAGPAGITADPASVIEVDGTSAVTNALGKLVKSGSGVLTFANTGANTFKGGIDISGGTVVFDNVAQLGTEGAPITFLGDATLRAGADGMTLGSTINVAAGKTAALDTGTYALTYQGQASAPSGTIVKAGTGTLTVTGTILGDTVDIDDGTVKIAPSGKVTAVSALNINTGGTFFLSDPSLLSLGSGATLANKGNLFVGKAAGAGQISNTILYANYAGNGGAINLHMETDSSGYVMVSDSLEVKGTTSGEVKLQFQQDAPLPAKATWKSLVPLKSDAIAPGTTIVSNAVELDSGIDRTLVYGSDGTWSWTDEVSPKFPSLIGADASSILIGKNSLSSLSQRLTNLRSIAPEHTLAIWTNGLAHYDEIRQSLYMNAAVRTNGVQVGGDRGWSPGDGHLTLGAFYDYAQSQMNQHRDISSAHTETTAQGYGVYGTYRTGRWYVDVLARGAQEDYDITFDDKPGFGTKGDSWAGSVEFGGEFLDEDKVLNWEPQVQLIYQTHRIDDSTDTFGRVYHVDSADSLEGRAGFRLWLNHEWKPAYVLSPYVRASYYHEFKGDSRVSVQNTVYENSLGGSRGVIDLGLAVRLGQRFSLDAKGSYGFGEKLKGFGFDLGGNLLW